MAGRGDSSCCDRVLLFYLDVSKKLDWKPQADQPYLYVPHFLTKNMATSVDTPTLNNRIPAWEAPGVTHEILEWANILTVDLSEYETKKSELVRTVATALQRDGFFYVTGHGIPRETVRISRLFCPTS